MFESCVFAGYRNTVEIVTNPQLQIHISFFGSGLTYFKALDASLIPGLLKPLYTSILPEPDPSFMSPAGHVFS